MKPSHLKELLHSPMKSFQKSLVGREIEIGRNEDRSPQIKQKHPELCLARTKMVAEQMMMNNGKDQ
jgi:hypothetical protein